MAFVAIVAIVAIVTLLHLGDERSWLYQNKDVKERSRGCYCY